MALLFLILVAAAPLVALLAVTGLRAPAGSLLVLYAATVPFGSGIGLPLGAPPPFDTLSSVLGVAAIASLLANFALSRSAVAVLHPAVPAWLLFVAAAAMTFGWSEAAATTAEELVLLFSVVALFALAAVTSVDVAVLRRLEVAIVVGGLVTSAAGLVMLVAGITPSGRTGAARLAITGNDPNHTAAALLLPLVLALGGTRSGTTASRIFHGGAAAVICTGIVLTGSRGGLAAAVVGAAVLGWNLRRRLRVLPAMAAIGLAATVAVGAAFAVAPPQLEERLTSTSTTGRSDIWLIGLSTCDRHCLAGSGWGTFPEVYQREFLRTPQVGGYRNEGYRAHNIFLQAAVETGLIGLLALVAAFAFTGAELRHLPAAVRATPAAVLAATVVASSLISNLTFKYFWLAIMYAVFSVTARRPTPGVEIPPGVGTLAATTP